MADKPKASDFRKAMQDQLDAQKQINDLTYQELSTVEKIFNSKVNLFNYESDYYEKVAAAQKKAEEYQKKINDANDKGIKLHHMTLKALQKELDADKQMLAIEEKKTNARIRGLKILEKTGKVMDTTWGYLMKSDKVIRSTNIALGLSGTKAEMMRSTFENAAGFVARFGGSLEDIGTLMTSFADETGRAKVLSADLVKDGMLISQATGMGAEAAGRMTGQFELMGMNMSNTAKYVEGVMETSERMGVNSNKVFKLLSTNFIRLQKMTFQSGVKGMAKMAQYSEKFKIDMSQTIDSTEKARTLEGAVDMMANLQVMGGKFADNDPFEMLYLSRNAPDKYIEKIGDMTKGMAHFKKMSDGTFQSFIAPADIDRIKFASKALGVDEATLTQTARRMGEIQEMRKRMTGMGLSPEQKEILEGMYTFDSRLNKFSVEIGGVTKDVTQLTSTELKMLKGQKASLEDRATAAQTFDDAFKATIMELKATLLPMLKGINGVLNTFRPIVVKLTTAISAVMGSGIGKFILSGAGILLTAGMVFKGLVRTFVNPLTEIFKGGVKKYAGTKLTQAMGRGGTGSVTPTLSPPTLTPTGAPTGAPTSAPAGSMGGGGKAAGIGAGIGMAAAGVGAGIGAAAAGISLLANAMSKLDEKKVAALQGIVRSISTVVAIGAVAAAVIMGIGISAEATAPGLGALALAVLGVGAGIGIAAAGIGVMGLGLSKLITSAKGSGWALAQVGVGIAAINLAMASTGIASLLGLGASNGLGKTLAEIAKYAPELNMVGTAFKEINTSLTGSDENFSNIKDMIAAISNMDVKKLSPLKDLANLFNKPLTVQFADKEVAIVSNITLNIDGSEFLTRINAGKKGLVRNDDQNKGKAGSGTIKTK